MAKGEEAKRLANSLLRSLNLEKVRTKKMFGCYCVYYDDEPVGWVDSTCFGLKEVGLENLPIELKRPKPDASVHEIPIKDSLFSEAWLPQAIKDTATVVKNRSLKNRRQK